MSAPSRPRTKHEDLQDGVVKLLGYTGWEHLHVRRTIGRGGRWVTATNLKGFPDLFCWSRRQPGRFLAIEVKIPPDKLRPEQETVRDSLVGAGVEFYVVTPDGLDDLATILRPRRG